MQVLGVIFLVSLVAYVVGHFASGRDETFPLSGVLSVLAVASGLVLAVNAI